MKRKTEQQIEQENRQVPTKKKIKPEQPELVIKFKNLQDQDEEVVDQKFATPWYRDQTKKISDPLLRMHNEMIDLYNYLSPTEQEHKIRTDALQFVKGLIKKAVEDCEVESFGSFITKTYLPNADIDIVVVKQDASDKRIYQKIYAMLQQHDEFTEISYLRNAKVPIIKFVYDIHKLHFDLSVNKMDGVYQLKEVQKALKIYPEMKYLIFVNKCILKQRQLSQTYTGGIGSYLLFSMILTFLRYCRKQKKNYTLGQYMLKYLQYYGMYNWSDKRIYVRTGEIVNRTPDGTYFSLMSPQDQSHDIGASSFKIKDVFLVYKNRYRLISNYNFSRGQSIMKYLVNPSNQIFSFLKQNQ